VLWLKVHVFDRLAQHDDLLLQGIGSRQPSVGKQLTAESSGMMMLMCWLQIPLRAPPNDQVGNK